MKKQSKCYLIGTNLDFNDVYIGTDEFPEGFGTKLNCTPDNQRWQLMIEANGDFECRKRGHALLAKNIKWYGSWSEGGAGDFYYGKGKSIALDYDQDTVF